MSWRIVAVTSRAKLDYKMNYLVVRTADETKRININEISVLLIESTGVSLIRRNGNVVERYGGIKV